MVPVRRPAVALAAARDANRRRLLACPNVTGTMLGARLVDGVATGELAVIVAVRRKKPKARLKPHERLPRTLAHGRSRVLVDVIEIARFARQSFAQPLVCSDRRTAAMVTCVAMSAAGPVGVSCAHALTGSDGDAFSADPVDLFSPGAGFVPAGRTRTAVFARGLGVPGDYGFSDIGCFSLDANGAAALATGRAPMRVWNGRAAAGPLAADAIRGRRLRGEVHAVLAEMLGGFCDLVVRVDDGGTIAGDSGMLWRTADGTAIAVHALGSVGALGQGSRFSGCMLAKRASELLNVTFLA